MVEDWQFGISGNTLFDDIECVVFVILLDGSFVCCLSAAILLKEES